MGVDLSDVPDLGYFFYPGETIDHPGHPRLDVVIREQPTLHHYDPEWVSFVVASAAGLVEGLTIHHPWQGDSRYRICAGRIILCDRLGKRVEAFSFGGQLHIDSNQERTVCALVSPAPIFSVYAFYDLATWVVDEVEILLAEQRAQWCPEHPHDFEDRVAAADPSVLYASCLVALQGRLRSQRSSGDRLVSAARHFVIHEIKRLQDRQAWPPDVPVLDQFL